MFESSSKSSHCSLEEPQDNEDDSEELEASPVKKFLHVVQESLKVRLYTKRSIKKIGKKVATSTKADPHSFYCTVCWKKVSCAHQGVKDVVRHIASTHHLASLKSIKNTPVLDSFPCVNEKKKEKVKIAIIDIHSIVISISTGN